MDEDISVYKASLSDHLHDLNSKLSDLSLNKDAVEQAINEQYHSLKALIEKYHQQLLDELNSIHNEKRIQIWENIDKYEKMMEKFNKNDSKSSSVIENNGKIDYENFSLESSDSKETTSNLDKSMTNTYFASSKSSPITTCLNSMEPDHIIFTPIELNSLESNLLPHLFGTLRTDKSIIDPLESSSQPKLNGLAITAADDLTPPVSNDVTPPISTSNLSPPAASESTPPPLSHSLALTSTSNHSPSQQLDLNDYITRVNLAQLAMINESSQPQRISSVSSVVSSTPSPQPTFSQVLSSLVPFENSGFVLNETSVNNLNELMKLSNQNQSGNEAPYYGLLPSQVLNPALPLSNALSSSSSSNFIPSNGVKLNNMQIRCKFGQLGSEKGFFASPHGFCLGVDEEIVIADTNNHRICVYDKSGEFKYQFGVVGKDDGQLWYPRKVIYFYLL
jgi:hypothetical protein